MALFAQQVIDGSTQPHAFTSGTLPPPPPLDGAGRRSLIDHCDYLLELIKPQPEFGIKLFDALGLTLCESLKGDGNVPVADLSEVDGYAVRAADTEFANADLQAVGQLVTLPVVDRMPVFIKGTAIRVTAGEPMPLGSDAVVAWEETEDRADNHIALLRVLRPGEGVRVAGSDVADRALFAHSGQVVTETMLGLLAAAGFDRVLARPTARVSVLSFDSIADPEAIDPADRRGRHLSSACSFLIGAALRKDNATVWRTEVKSLDPEYLRELIDSELVRSDMIVATSAIGIRALRDELAELGEIDFCNVAVEPAGDQAFALVGDHNTPMFLLAADPATAFTNYHMIVRPALRKLMGVLPHRPQPKLCFVGDNVASQEGVFELFPMRLRQVGGRSIATPFGRGRFATLSDLAQADALVAVPEDKAWVAAGEPVQAWEF